MSGGTGMVVDYDERLIMFLDAREAFQAARCARRLSSFGSSVNEASFSSYLNVFSVTESDIRTFLWNVGRMCLGQATLARKLES